MDETRTHIEPGHPLQGPHIAPGTFVPLLLRLEPASVLIEVGRPLAVLGRHTEADVRLAFSAVSRHHCRVFFEAGQWRVADLNSLNGVFVNDERVAETALYTGDVLRLGEVTLVVESGTPLRGRRPEGDEMLRQIAESLPPE